MEFSSRIPYNGESYSSNDWESLNGDISLKPNTNKSGLKATCMDMCPAEEREFRESNLLLDKWECVDGPFTNKKERKTSAQFAVKVYSRSAAGAAYSAENIRPPEVLKKTLDHIFNYIIANYGIGGGEGPHSFIWDRTRQIRKDLILQDCQDEIAVEIHERIARFHIMATNYSCEDINMKLECDELRNTLKSLVVFYSELRKKGREMPNEIEFVAYYVLLHPSNNEALSKIERRLPQKIFHHPLVQKALDISMAMSVSSSFVNGTLNHFARIFNLLRNPEIPYLFACCAHIQFVNIRNFGLSAMQMTYYHFESNRESGIAVERMMDFLGFDNIEETSMFLKHYGIEVTSNEPYMAFIGRKISLQKKKIYPEFPFRSKPDKPGHKTSLWIEQKRKNMSDLEILNGGLNEKFTNEVSVLSKPSKSLNTNAPIFVPAPTKPIVDNSCTSSPESKRVPSTPTLSPESFILSRPVPGRKETAFIMDDSPKIPIQYKQGLKVPSDENANIKNQELHEKLNMIQNDIANFIIDPIIEDLVKETVFEVLESNRESFGQFLQESLVDELIVDIICEEITVISKTNDYRLAIREVSTQILNELILEITLKSFVQSKREHLLSRRYFSLWKKQLTRLNTKRWTEEIRRNRNKQILNQIVPFARTKLHAHSVNAQMEDRITFYVEKIQKHSNDSRKEIDLKTRLIPFIELKCDNLKLVFSSGSGVKLPGPGKSVENWVIFKISKSGGAFAEDNGIKLLNEIKFEKDHKNCTIILQQVSHDGDELPVLQHNSISGLSGVNGCIYHADYFGDEFNEEPRLYWKTQNNNIIQFLKRLPLHSNVPLLILYWNSPFQEEVEREFRNIVESFSKEYPIEILKIHFANLGDGINIINSSAEENLLSGMKWLIENAANPPKLKQGILSYIENPIFSFEWGVEKISQVIPEDDYFVINYHYHCFNGMINIFNTLLHFIVDIVTSPSLEYIAFPAREYARFFLDWNTTESFEDLKNLENVYSLPSLSIPRDIFEQDIKSKTAVEELYLKYLENLKKILSHDDLLYLKNKLLILLKKQSKLKELFFEITNVLFGKFSKESFLQLRPFNPDIIDKAEFANKVRALVGDVHKFKDIKNERASKRKRPRTNNLSVNSENFQIAEKRLKNAMTEALDLLNSFN